MMPLGRGLPFLWVTRLAFLAPRTYTVPQVSGDGYPYTDYRLDPGEEGRVIDDVVHMHVRARAVLPHRDVPRIYCALQSEGFAFILLFYWGMYLQPSLEKRIKSRGKQDICTYSLCWWALIFIKGSSLPIHRRYPER